MTSTKNLFVFNASAGSGKTYKLSQKFLEYLIDEYKKGNKDAYKYVMAVTFTNKATLEMKSRIIARLYEYSKDNSFEDQDIAKDILQRLVHDYTMFRVSTIDSFFQKVLKAFALEMGSRSAYDTSLDTDGAIEAALDNVYSKIETDSDVRKVIEDISLSRLEEGKNWNWRDDLLKLCRKQLVTYKPVPEKDLRDFMKRLDKRTDALNTDFVEKVFSVSDDLIQAYNRSGLQNGNNKVNSNFKKWLSGASRKYFDRSLKVITGRPEWMDNWFSGDYTRVMNKNYTQADIDAVENSCGGQLRRLKKLFDDNYTIYLTVHQIKKNIKESALFNKASRELEDYLKSEQLTLLSKAPEILKDLIDGSDTPFVYEKIGATIDHYLLDEFQDTSVEQWENFKPLVGEGLSRLNQSLLVGDIKQSIYRFRRGDWNLLRETVRRDFPNDIDSAPLNTNYRSLSNIVKFNNLAFSSPGFVVNGFRNSLDELTGDGQKEEKKRLSWTIAEIYGQSRQDVWDKYDSAKQRGVVHVISCQDNKDKEAVIGRDDFIVWDVARKIKGLISSGKGYSFKDIAVLTSRGKDASKVANYLVNRGIPIVSGESLKIDSNPVVALILEIMKRLVDTESKGVDVMARLSGISIGNMGKLDFNTKEGEAFLGKAKGCNTLYQICKLILKEFVPDIQTGYDSFVKAFLDRVLDYSSSNGTSISNFLRWWEDSCDKFFIPEPTGGDAVKIMTMHKAKGLDFPVVFIPFIRDEMIDFKKDNKWFDSPAEIKYSGKLLLPLGDKGSNLDNTFYQEQINKERMEQYIDNLNLAYVTFTRPKERLYIYAKGKRGEHSNNAPAKISILLGEWCEVQSQGPTPLFLKKEDVLDFDTFRKEDSSIKVDEAGKDFKCVDYVLGDDSEVSYSSSNKDDKKSSVSLFVEKEVNEDKVPVLSGLVGNESSRAKLKGEWDGDDNVRRGVLWHQLYSMIEEVGEGENGLEEAVGKAVDRFLKKNPGSLLGDDKGKLVSDVSSKISSFASLGWFDAGKKVMNEVSILSGIDMWRPDRVLLPADDSKDWAQVVDYKFGLYEKDSSKHRSYVKQVKNYMKLLREMGYSDVKGWLWYVLEDKVEEAEEVVG